MEPIENTVPKKKEFSTPLAIVIAGVFVGLGVFFGLSYKSTPKEEVVKEYEVSIKESDYIFGNKDADIVIVEYSDMECPFCKQFHVSMEQLIQEYPNDVAWVYRHLPLESIHPKARSLASASECVGSLGGDEAFYSFISSVFSGTPDKVQEYAKNTGINIDTYNTCVSENTFDSKITASIDEAREYGIQGTPFSFILKNGEVIGTIPGAMPYEALKKMVQEAK